VKTDDILVAFFPDVDEFLSCLKTLKEEKYAIANAFSPVRLPEMQDLLTREPSFTRTFTLIGGILFASLFAFVSWVFKAGLPQLHIDPGYDAAFSGHKFGVLVSAAGDSMEKLERLLKERGAEEVRRVTA
jgi:hypothetical protein